MGKDSAAWAIATSTRLTDGAARVLAYVALHTMDRDTPPIYSGGWKAIAVILYGEPDDGPITPANKRRLARHFAELIGAGKLKPIGSTARKHRQSYELLR